MIEGMKNDVIVIGATEQCWPDETGPWVMRLTYAIIGDRPGVVGVEIYAVEPEKIRRAVGGWPKLVKPLGDPEAITTTGSRIPLAEQMQKYLMNREHNDSIIAKAPNFPPSLRQMAAERLDLLAGKPRPPKRSPGRPSIYDRDHFEKVAAIYTEALLCGKSSPINEITKAIPGTSRSAATKWVAKAREYGMLPITVQGKSAAWTPSSKKEGEK